MACKGDFPTGDDLPPPYTSSSDTAAASPMPYSTAVFDADSHSSVFSSHLSTLRDQIRSAQASHASAANQQDTVDLALLVPHVEGLLSTIASFHPPPKLVEATVVPDAAIGKDWKFVDEDHRQPGQVRRVILVQRSTKVDGDRKSPPTVERREDSYRDMDTNFDGWGRWEDGSGTAATDSESYMWWSDEARARRLANYLEPDRPTASVDRQTVRAQVVQTRETKKAQRWGFFKKDTPSSPTPSAPAPTPAAKASPIGGSDISMTVRAEEVTFRRENAFGVWESKTGWGLVVRVRIRDI